MSSCTVGDQQCVSEATGGADDCLVSCDGLYADIQYFSDSATENFKHIKTIMEQYNAHKDKFAKSLVFDLGKECKYINCEAGPAYFSECSLPENSTLIFIFSDSSISYNPQVVEIFFDTATYTEIEKDRKVTVGAQLGVIGGTMGLFTGFSILSAVEIIYYLARALMTTGQPAGGSQVIKVHPIKVDY